VKLKHDDGGVNKEKNKTNSGAYNQDQIYKVDANGTTEPEVKYRKFTLRRYTITG
jgi:hypothetical protein